MIAVAVVAGAAAVGLLWLGAYQRGTRRDLAAALAREQQAAVDAREDARAARAELAAIEARNDQSWWERLRKERVLLHLIDDSTVRGIAAEVFPDGVLLLAAELLDVPADGSTLALGGELFVERSRIALTQHERAADG